MLGAGRYRVGPLKAGRYRVQVDDGLNPTVQAKAVTVSAGNVVEVSVELERGARISGRVVDDDGAPVANVWVSASSSNPANRGGAQTFNVGPSAGGGLGRVLTDPDGHFVLDRLARSSTVYALHADQPSGAAVTKEGVETGSTDVVITLPSLGIITGVVVDSTGSPVAEARIRASSTESDRPGAAQLTDAQGQFTLRAIVPGQVDVQAFRQGAGGMETGEATVTLSSRQTLTGVRVVLQPPAIAERQSGGPPDLTR